MIKTRKSEDRGFFDHGWLKTYHTFSFADYQDPKFMGFKSLRVINEDVVEPGKGFATHSHRDMEIMTYILSGALEHKDSMGNTSVIKPGDIQRMSAGTGVTHSEFNPSASEGVHLLQIWILPTKTGFAPSYEQKAFDPKGKENKLRLVVSPDGRDGTVRMNQGVYIFDSRLKAGHDVCYEKKEGFDAWIQLTKGELNVEDETLHAGDGAFIIREEEVNLSTPSAADFLLFDLS